MRKFKNLVENGASQLEPYETPCYGDGVGEVWEAHMGGVFIAIDGIDGAGKTTLASALATIFHQLNPLVTKEPTNDSYWGKALRRSAETGRLNRKTEIEYFHKDRLYHIENAIKPALRQNRLVITDRYVDSTLAFQAPDPHSADEMWRNFEPSILTPDITFILKCKVETGLERIVLTRKQTTTFETIDALRRARSIYESRRGNHYYFLDSEGTPEDTLVQALFALSDRLSQFSRIRENVLDFMPTGFDRNEFGRAAAEYNAA